MAKRGRPKGSSTLTKAQIDNITLAIYGGTPVVQAAIKYGVSRSRHYEYLARAEGRIGPPATPKIREYAKRVTEAEAQAQMVAEMTLFRDDKAAWLRAHRKKEAASSQSRGLSLDHHDLGDPNVRAELVRVAHALCHEDPSIPIPECSDDCPFRRAG